MIEESLLPIRSLPTAAHLTAALGIEHVSTSSDCRRTTFYFPFTREVAKEARRFGDIFSELQVVAREAEDRALEGRR